jgi:hypothetical protein
MSRIRVCIAIAIVLFALAVPLAAANMDLVVMVDTSTSMFPYFDELMHYLIQDLLTAKLHAGDSFHLLSFDSTPEEELSLEMGGAEAAEMAFGRLLLLQPLGRYTDLVAALQYLYRYTKELPDTNPKTILLVTDGVHDPPPNSSNRGSPDQIRSRIDEIAGQVEKEGWTIHILKVPAEPAPGEEGLPSYLPDISKVLEVPIVPYKTEERTQVTGELMGFPTLDFPPPLGQVGSRFRAPFRINNYSSEPIIVRLASVQSDGMELLDRSVAITVASKKNAPLGVPIRLPSSLAKGDYSMKVSLRFEGDLRISPTTGTLQFTFTGGSGGLPILVWNLSYLLYGALALIVVLVLVLLLLFLRRKLREVPLAGVEKATLERHAAVAPAAADEAAEKRGVQPDETARTADREPAASPARGHARRKRVPLMDVGAPVPWKSDQARITAPKPPTAESLRSSLPLPLLRGTGLPPIIELRVSEQNSRIGFRNIHRIPRGGGRSVGGGFSSYLVFLVPVPHAIASIRNEDGHYTFVPLRKEYFPDISGPLSDCIGVDIPVVSRKGYGFFIRFREWISPLDEINALMRSIHREE